MSTGPNLEIDFATRLSNLETAVFGGPNPAGNEPNAGGNIAGGPCVSLTGSADVLPLNGNAYVNSTGVDEMTLAQPIAGPPAAGGQDGQTLLVYDQGGHAHTVTTAANGIDGNKHIATFGGTAQSYIRFRAFNGVWTVVGSSGVTLS